MLGGISHIAGFVEGARALHPASVLVDSGNLWFEEPEISETRRAQEDLKAGAIARMYASIDAAFGVPGPHDFALGAARYAELMRTAKLEPAAINLGVEGIDAMGGARVVDLAGTKVGLVPAVDPTLFEGIEGVTPRPLEPRLEEGDQAGRGGGRRGDLARVPR